jgi:hypothetical protein
MPLVNLTLETLGDLNSGMAGAVIDAALKEAVRDTDDRGGDKKPRKVQITVTMLKIGDESVAVDVDAKCVLPAYHTESTVAKLSYAGPGAPGLLFQSENHARPDQAPLPFEGGDAKKAE